MPGTILAVTQTSDGNLWIGTEFGILRFDGVRFRTWRPPSGAQVLGESVHTLVAARDGTLWIGTKEGLSHWQKGKIENYTTSTGPAGPGVAAILEDRGGVVWAGTIGYRSGGLCRVEKTAMRCYGPHDGLPGQGVSSLMQDPRGVLWIGGLGGFATWAAADHRVYPLTGPLGMIHSIVQDKTGETWMSTGADGGLLHFVNGKAEPYRASQEIQAIQPHVLLADRDGALWIGTLGQGIVHLAQGHIDRFTHADGLSNDTIRCLFEDKEGNIWAGTESGLDRFREFAVTLISASQGLSRGMVNSVFAAPDGAVWVGTNHGLHTISDGKVALTDTRNGLPSQSITGIFEEQNGRLWVDSAGGLGYRDQGRFLTLKQAEARNIRSIVAAAEGRDHSVWISDPNQGLVRLHDGRVSEVVPWSQFQNKFASALEAGVNGGLWLGFSQGGLAYYKPGQPTRWYSAADGLTPGAVMDLHLTRDGTLWIATDTGLGRFKDGAFATLGTTNGLPCERVHALVEDDYGALWLKTACGLVRIGAADLNAWSSKPKSHVQVKFYDASEGMPMHATPSGYSRRAVKSSDGRLWFAVLDGVALVDPKHLPENHLLPPVEIEQITADHKSYPASPGLPLPPRTKDLQIDYTALSFVAPEKVQFRYKLEGFDTQWQEVGVRQAVYTNLPPKQYRFRVIACNNDGVWNQAGASLDFTILPAFYQTSWFEALVIVLLGILAWMLYRLRIRQVAKGISLRFEERLAERTRIGRELHDTLLQNISGFALQLDGLAKTVTAPLPAKERLRDLRQQAEQWLHEARESVWDLRRPISEGQELDASLHKLGDQITAGLQTRFHVAVSGHRVPLPRKVHEHLFRIAQEASRNAIHHGRAKEIRIDIAYRDGKAVGMKIRDDGCGFDLEECSLKTGHWGLATMRERAQQINAEFRITTAPGRGTEIEILAPI